MFGSVGVDINEEDVEGESKEEDEDEEKEGEVWNERGGIVELGVENEKRGTEREEEVVGNNKEGSVEATLDGIIKDEECC